MRRRYVPVSIDRRAVPSDVVEIDVSSSREWTRLTEEPMELLQVARERESQASGMRSALWLPLFDGLADPVVVARLAAEAEEAGWHRGFVWDHLRWQARGLALGGVAAAVRWPCRPGSGGAPGS